MYQHFAKWQVGKGDVPRRAKSGRGPLTFLPLRGERESPILFPHTQEMGPTSWHHKPLHLPQLWRSALSNSNPQQSSAEPINTGSSLLKTKRLSTLCFLSTNTLIFLLYWQISQSKVLSQHFFGFFSHFLLPLPHQTTALLKCLTEILRGLPGNTQLPRASQAKVKENDLLGSPSLMFYIHIHTYIHETHPHTYVHTSCFMPLTSPTNTLRPSHCPRA